MLCQLSYGHQARTRFYQEKVTLGRWLGAPSQELGLLVVLLAFVHDLEDSGRRGVVYHRHVAVGVVDLNGDAEIVAGLVLVGDLEGGLDSDVLLVAAVATQLQDGVGVEASRAQFAGVAQTTEDRPDVADAVLVHELYGDPDHVVYRVGLGLYSLGGHINSSSRLSA